MSLEEIERLRANSAGLTAELAKATKEAQADADGKVKDLEAKLAEGKEKLAAAKSDSETVRATPPAYFAYKAVNNMKYI